MKSKKYPNLHKLSWTPNWVFRKYSSEKHQEFVASTGVLAEEKNAAKAYKIGVEKFDDWLKSYLPSGRQILIRDIGRAVLSTKESKKGGIRGAQYRSAQNQINNHIIPEFGHLRPDQVTSIRWQHYDTQERARVRHNAKGKELPPRKALFNTRKFLIEIMRRAFDEGLIKRIPEFQNNDPEPAEPRYLRRKEIRKFLHAASPGTKLLAFIMWKQGPRPSEACQYRYSMIDFEEGPSGVIRIPGEITKNGKPRTIPLNSRVSRVLKREKRRSTTDCIFPSPTDPDRPISEYKTGFETAFAKAGIKNAIPYNFRDTAITDMLRRGKSPTFIGKYVQNSAVIIEGRYAVAVREEMEGVAG
jgi:site-specific recombinase XerD